MLRISSIHDTLSELKKFETPSATKHALAWSGGNIFPTLFIHRQVLGKPAAEKWKPDDARVSRPVLGRPRVRFPRPSHRCCQLGLISFFSLPILLRFYSGWVNGPVQGKYPAAAFVWGRSDFPRHRHFILRYRITTLYYNFCYT